MIQRIFSWFGSLPSALIAASLVLLLGLVGGGGYYAFRTYDYVQHDNDFCLSCHLMEDPYDRFARSAHQGLGCKACHQPTFLARSEMALTQIIENPRELTAHAEVTNDRCESCHVRGDPEKWNNIKNSVGHRIHFESMDTTLQGLMCVQCHSTTLHEFAPTDRTCGQSGCHADIQVRLGKMSDLTIHCVACHNYNAPVPQGASSQTLFAAIRPGSGECLSCHAMREMVNMPPDEPHNGVCSTCHNAHEQATPAEAVTSCAKAGCHDAPTEITPLHRGLAVGVLEQCTTCHKAHSWKAAGGDCLSCHQNIYQEDPAPARRTASATALPGGRGALLAARFASAAMDPTPGLVHAPAADGETLAAPEAPATQAMDTPFRHGEHRGVDCLSCHSNEPRHGALTVTTLADCRGCHHTAPVASNCTTCHTAQDAPTGTLSERRTLDFSVESPVQRDLPFDHAKHTPVPCGRCHTGGLELSASDVDCDSCHEPHHRVEEVRCASCHRARREPPHTVQVHEGCTGSGCHAEVPFRGVPRARNLCLTCHTDREDHRVGQPCENCHTLPEVPGGAR